MKKRFKKSRRRLIGTKKAQRRLKVLTRYQPYVTPKKEKRKILIFASELAFLCLNAFLYGKKRLETGGQLFGYATVDGTPVVAYVLGPGPNSCHEQTFFQQDLSYLDSEGERIIQEGKLIQLGEWHSHHRLGLPFPSAHDSHSMLKTLRLCQGLRNYLLCIATCNERTAASTPYMFNLDGYETWEWEIIPGDSPVRKMLEQL